MIFIGFTDIGHRDKTCLYLVSFIEEKYVRSDMMVGVGGCVPCFYDDTIFQFHLSENNICLLIMLSVGSQCKTYHINI